MKAAVCYEIGKPQVIEDLQIDTPKKGHVKVRVAATAICHSDIHSLKGELPGRVPMVGGHETAGYVEEVGEGVERVKPGDPVVVSLLFSCGKCYYCITGKPHLCRNIPFDPSTHLTDKKGQGIVAVLRVGGFAEEVIVDERQCIPIPNDVPMASACLIACGVMTGFGAAMNRAHVQPKESVVIIGTGGVGLNAVQGAAYCGAFPVIAVDVLDNKLEAAKIFGATHTINSAKEKDLTQAVRELTSGRGADYVFVTVGVTSAVAQGLEMAGPRGMTVVVGLPPVKDTLTIVPTMLVGTEKVLTGGYMGSTNVEVDVPFYVTLYKNGKLKLDELVTHRFPLEKINEAIEEVENGQALRNVIIFE